jgi:Spt5 C-terminal nonapeptide repeat binding Spt4
MGPPRGSFGDGGFGAGGRTPNPYASSGGGGWGGGRTPNPYVTGGGKTPAWGTSKTPNPYTEGGRTPFSTSSQTPNPYTQEGGRTPAWGSARTPNPYTAKSSGTGTGWGGATPAWGGATPKPTSSNESPSAPANNGWASPGPPASGGWGESSWVSCLKLTSIHGSTYYTNRLHRHPLSALRRRRRLLPPLVDQAMVRRCIMPRHQPECLPVVLICLRRPQLHTHRMSGLGRQHSVSVDPRMSFFSTN